MRAKVLVLGASGMLGHKVWQACRDRFDAYATIRAGELAGPAATVLDADRTLTGVDAEEPDSIVSALDETGAEAVVNCVGVVKQLAAGSDPLRAIPVNALFPHQLAASCRDRGARLVHISTDCVFSGARGRYTEEDTPDPVDLYGRSKLLGEVAADGCLTLRTSIIGRELTSSRGLLEWFLQQEGSTARGFTRAIFSGLTTDALAALIARMLADGQPNTGLWHVAGDPISKYDLLVLLRDALGLDVEIEPDDSVVIDRSLDATRFRAQTGWSPDSWPRAVAALAADGEVYEEIRSVPH